MTGFGDISYHSHNPCAILLPRLKIKTKEDKTQYPDYLADNRAKLSEDQYAAYNKQCELTRRFHHDFA